MFKPVDQTVFGPRGNCHSACLASMLGIPITEVPNFWYMGDSPQACFAALRDWLNKHGWTIITFPANDPEAIAKYLEGYYLLGGISPSGYDHCTIWKGDKMVHDPHPSRSGLIRIDSFEVIYPLEPWKWVKSINRKEK